MFILLRIFQTHNVEIILSSLCTLTIASSCSPLNVVIGNVLFVDLVPTSLFSFTTLIVLFELSICSFALSKQRSRYTVRDGYSCTYVYVVHVCINICINGYVVHMYKRLVSAVVKCSLHIRDGRRFEI